MTEKIQESPDAPQSTKKLLCFKLIVYTAYCISIITLSAIILAIIVNRKIQPFHDWVEGSHMESFGEFLAGLIIEQKVNHQISESSSPLTMEEQKRFEEIIKKYKDDKKSFNLSGLEARDMRFIIEHPHLKPIRAGKYLILTNSSSKNIYNFGGILDDLYVNFIKEMIGADFKEKERSRPHICYFKNRSEYLKISKEANKHFHDSLGFFSPVKNCIYLFSRKDSLEGLEVEEKFAEAVEKGSLKYEGQDLDLFLDTLELNKSRYIAKLDEETLCTLRHEGAHQLSYMLGLHSLRGFEKRWLTEGIAQYFETVKPGQVRNAKRQMLRDFLSEKKLHSWASLVNSDEGTFKSKDSKYRQLAYSQSWLIVRFLMKKYRPEFFQFIKVTREKGALDSPLRNIDILCKLLGSSVNKLSAELDLEIENL